MEENNIQEEKISELFKLSDIKSGLKQLKGFGNVVLKSAVDVADALLTTFRTFFTIRTSKVAKLLNDYASRTSERDKSIQASLRNLESDNLDFLIFAPQAFLASKIGQITYAAIDKKRQTKLAATGKPSEEGDGLLTRLNKLFFITSSRHYLNNLLSEALLEEDPVVDFKRALQYLDPSIELPDPKEELKRLLKILNSAEEFIQSRKEALDELDEIETLEELEDKLTTKPELRSSLTALKKMKGVKGKDNKEQLALIQFSEIKKDLKDTWAATKEELKDSLDKTMPSKSSLLAASSTYPEAIEVLEKYEELSS